MASLDNRRCQELLERSPVGRLATVTADGAAHVVPCCFSFEGDRIYSVVDGKPKSTTALRRLNNIRANNMVSLVVDHYADDWKELWWVRIDGKGVIVDELATSGPSDVAEERAAALDQLMDKYQQYRRQPPEGPLLRIDITGVTGWAYDLDREPSSQ